eukprot:CAMPEP_0172618542 /NCGR_PEP_ID=MMETSP1068-20121228/82395_1 /TAXON_ID=35684 /ORGANISM="Pseudopedinella elastica, Strain CCMP716" /LENGTH=49 /DNA_ID= /DNA_START= /DNA_END= /DNA_ORIENTATION=
MVQQARRPFVENTPSHPSLNVATSFVCQCMLGTMPAGSCGAVLAERFDP